METAASDDAPLRAVRAALRQWDQFHVLERLDASPALQQQLLHFESWYAGGVGSYLCTATRLYREQQGDAASSPSPSSTSPESDPFASWVPTIPRDAYGLLSLDAPKFRELEAAGLRHAGHSAFVVVAGGLGERLGYQGIKLALPVETVTRRSYIEFYIQHIRALQREVGGTARIPLAIMTSDATHAATEAFLAEHDFFGLPHDQVTLLKQDTVPCLDAVAVDEDDDSEAALHLVVDAASGELVMKPHGHGDVHTLLHASGLAREWLERHGTRYVHFMQDTNALILQSTLPLLGASVANGWKWAFTVVPRKAKDASGGIVRFTHPTDPRRSALFNVEYHELDHFLRTKAGDAFRDGDTNDAATGFSPFPGNINHFVAELATYVRVLDASRGKTPEIFNPKYRADRKALFRSPARLECMMQDFPKSLVAVTAACASALEGGDASDSASDAIGFLSFPASLVYSPCKNDTASAASKVLSDIPPQCACSAEHDFFALNKAKLAQVGVQFTADGEATGIDGSRPEWLGIPVPASARGPLIVFSPSVSVSLDSLQRRFPSPSEIRISNRSTLIIDGLGASELTISSLTLDGALRITATAGADMDLSGLACISNAGFEYTPADGLNADAVDAMRGYVLTKRGQSEIAVGGGSRDPQQNVLPFHVRLTKRKHAAIDNGP